VQQSHRHERKTKNMKKSAAFIPRFPRLTPVKAASVFASLAFTALLLSATTGCTAIRPQKGGKAVTVLRPNGAAVQTLSQGENPSQPSTQEQETTRTYSFPAGYNIPAFQNSIIPPSGNIPMFQHSNIPFSVTEHTRSRTELGAAQKDTAREIGAKLASLKGIVWVGVVMFIFGLASIFWPPLKLIIGSVTTSAAITLGGLVLMVLPTLIVGHELIIFGGVVLVVGAWFLAHRHGQLRGLLAGVTTRATAEKPAPTPIPHGAANPTATT
jgi:hypothetical protein